MEKDKLEATISPYESALKLQKRTIDDLRMDYWDLLNEMWGHNVSSSWEIFLN